MQSRSRIRGRDPPPSAGRYRRRSPSPRHQRRPRDPSPTRPPRRSPDPPPPPRRYKENPLPSASSAAACAAAARADILLEAGRLAAQYLVAKGVLPELVLRAREDTQHRSPGSRPEPPAPAPATYGRKRDEDDGPRWRRSGAAAGDWSRGKGDDDRQARRSGWDRKSNSFDGRRKHNGGGGDVGRGGRRTRNYDEPKRPPVSRSYSHMDRRASADAGVDRRRSRSRSRSRTSTRSYYAVRDGSRRDSDWREGARGLNHTKVPDSGTTAPVGHGDVHHGDVDEMPRQPKVPSSVVVMEANDSEVQAMAMEDAQVESEIVGLDHSQDISEDEDGEFAEDISEDEDAEFAVDGLKDEDGEMDVSQCQLSDSDVHPSESIDEPVHMQSQLSNVEEEMETGMVPMDTCMAEPQAENNDGSEVRHQTEAAQSDAETAVGDLNCDEQELPAWYGMFDLNVVESPKGCEISEICGGPLVDHVCDYVPELVGQMNQQSNYDASEEQGQDEHAGANHLLEDGHDLNNYDLNNEADEHAQDDTSKIQGQDEHSGDNHLLEDGHDLNNYDLNNEADEHAQDDTSEIQVKMNMQACMG